MRAKEFLHKTLSPVIHKKRLDTLTVLVEGLLLSKKLSVTELGRGIHSNASERSAIRRSDRFIGNQKIHKELPSIYQAHMALLIGTRTTPEIIVDWTHIPNANYNSLSAALVCKGRALILYEEVHPMEDLGNREVQKNFLIHLRLLMPNHCKPIIITDAGFHNYWFKTVLSCGWDYVGRVRGLQVYNDGEGWLKCKDLMKEANNRPIYKGEKTLCKNNKLATHFFLIKKPPKNRKHRARYRPKSGGRDVRIHNKSAHEPWLLVSSLSNEKVTMAHTKKVIAIYEKRMQIEESFRDLKSTRYGFGLTHAYSRCSKRITLLLLIAMLAALVAWLTGYAMEQSNMHYQFQVNSIKSKRVLSFFFLGCRGIQRQQDIGLLDFFEVIKSIQEETAHD